MNHYLTVLKKYAIFNGRAPRAEYWYFFLFNILASVLVNIVSKIIGDTYSILSVIYSLAVIIPGIAVSIRRLHDIGKSGWWLFICLIPIVGQIWLIILFVINSTPADNKYGPNTK